MRVILHADQRSKQNHKDENLPALPQEPFLLEREFGPMLKKENIQSPIMKCRRNYFIFFVTEVYPEKMMEQFNSGESRTIFTKIAAIVIIGQTTSGRKAWQEEETRKDYSIVLILQEQSCTFRPLLGLSGLNLIDLTLQDNVASPSGFFQYIYHVGCAINLHSIINSGLILGGQNLSNRQTVFFLLVNPMNKKHMDPDTIDLNEPRHAQYTHKAW